MLKLIAIIEAPSILGLRPTGVEDLPDALVSAGLLARLQARHAGRVNAPMYGDVRDRETGFLNTHGIADYSRRLAERVDEVFGQGEFALVLGGDCSILLGPMLALNRRGRHGLLFLDGHHGLLRPGNKHQWRGRGRHGDHDFQSEARHGWESSKCLSEHAKQRLPEHTRYQFSIGDTL
jgi:arginase family enzyme